MKRSNKQKKRVAETGKTHSRPTKKFKTRTERLLDESNQGVVERNKRDEDYHEAVAKTFSNSRKRLEEKAKLYDALASGNIPIDELKICGSLVDFERKLYDEEENDTTSSYRVSDPHEEVSEGDPPQYDDVQRFDSRGDNNDCRTKEMEHSRIIHEGVTQHRYDLRKRLEKLREAKATEHKIEVGLEV